MTDIDSMAKTYIREITDTLRLMEDTLPKQIEAIVGILVKARDSGHRVYIFGNGGSASTASHMASDLNKGSTRPDAPRFRAIALTDNTPIFSALANDSSYEDVFVEQLKNHLEKDDVVIGISGSGNSPNILRGLEYARSSGAVTIAVVGFDGGKAAGIAEISLIVPAKRMQQIEDVHLVIEHMVSLILKESADCSIHTDLKGGS